jgi:hypothetical protein
MTAFDPKRTFRAASYPHEIENRVHIVLRSDLARINGAVHAVWAIAARPPEQLRDNSDISELMYDAKAA